MTVTVRGSSTACRSASIRLVRRGGRRRSPSDCADRSAAACVTVSMALSYGARATNRFWRIPTNSRLFERFAFRISDVSDERWRTLPSGAFASFLPFFLFEHGLMKISRDGFGDRFVGDCGRVFVFCYLNDKFTAFEA